MPIEVGMAAPFEREQFAIPAGCAGRYGSAEEKCGDLELVSPQGLTQGVQVKIYRTTLEHFAVVYPQKKICKPIGVINLKNASCQRLTESKRHGVVLRQRGFDNNVAITFLSDYPSELDSWLASFAGRAQQPVRQCSMPVLEEDDEF